MPFRLFTRFWIAATLLAAGLSPATAASVAPSIETVQYYARPLVRARLRLPNSLRDLTVTKLAPKASDAGRFEVEVRFTAATPFGGRSSHTAHFEMRRTADGRDWIVTLP